MWIKEKKTHARQIYSKKLKNRRNVIKNDIKLSYCPFSVELHYDKYGENEPLNGYMASEVYLWRNFALRFLDTCNVQSSANFKRKK